MTEIRVPKLNNNDTDYTLVDWLVEEGKPVAEGDPVVVVETSKAAEELECPAEGTLHRAAPTGTTCAPGDVIGHVLAPGESPAPASAPAAAATADAAVTVTNPARALMTELGVPEDRVLALGVKVVRRTDVEQLAARIREEERSGAGPAGPDDTAVGSGVDPALAHALPPVQQAVGRSVVRSQQTIPAAYTVVKVDVGEAQRRASAAARRMRRLIGLPELLLTAVSRAHESFPLFFARLADDRTAVKSEAAHVGVTMDVGKGLFVPVVRRASELAFEEIVEAVSGYRRTAMTGTFRESELSGGNITVTLHNDADVVAAVPFVFPGQVCALALAGPQQELVQDADATVRARTVANLGVAYDHRLLNGRDALLFLQRLKAQLEAPEKLFGPRDAEDPSA
ncbi:2-oxo acid dehydrogenase subunit E2 [Streptomyces sp. MAR4 CNX-425]|uniref:2-oxo acid dehydrogenase subunit E2 n=1 Tax=Streptomyces sp. MAR4 CNX-425 TaxID=3406343 RepID=UPI003B50A1E6